MRKKRKMMITDYDNIILLIYFALIIIGAFMQLNINSVRDNLNIFFKQTVWLVLSIFSLWFSFKVISIELLRKLIFPFVVITFLLLLGVAMKAYLAPDSAINGSIRSFRVLGINIQPSLIARVILVLFTANVLAKKKDWLEESTPAIFLKNFNFLLVVISVFYLFILSERHFTPLIISGLTLLWMMILAKIPYRTIGLLILIVFLLGVSVLHWGPQYRNSRMNIFKKYSLVLKALNLSEDYDGDNEYQIRESLIALASGGLLGRGPNRGLAKHYFLPEAKTDYVFSIIGEDFGLWGSLLILLAYCALFWRIWRNAFKETDLFVKFAGIGLGMNIFFNAMVNIGVSISALPSTGVTLPFISYGGTSLLINSITIGLLLNFSAERRRVI